MLSNAGFAVFISGNKRGPEGNVIEAPGVIEEFDICHQLGKIPIPFGASGWAAHTIWQRVSENPSTYYGTRDVSDALKTLGDAGKSEDEHLGAIFSRFQKSREALSSQVTAADTQTITQRGAQN